MTGSAVGASGSGHARPVRASRARALNVALQLTMVGAPLAALLDTLGVRQVDVVGYSLGGDVALQTAIRHPDRVGRLVAISAPFARDGFFPEVVETFAQMEAHAPAIAANVQHSPRATMYPDVRWETLFRKNRALNGAPSTGRTRSLTSRPRRASSSPTPTRSGPSTSSSSTAGSVAVSATRGRTARDAHPTGLPSYRGRPTTTCSPRSSPCAW